jgi:hypothetical protein
MESAANLASMFLDWKTDNGGGKKKEEEEEEEEEKGLEAKRDAGKALTGHETEFAANARDGKGGYSMRLL